MKSTHLVVVLTLAGCGGAVEPEPEAREAALSRIPPGGVSTGDLPVLTPVPPDPSMTPPSAPLLDLTQRTAHSISLRWADTSAYETSNAIERSLGSTGVFSTIALSPAQSGGVSSFTDNNRAADTRHCYRVRSTNAAGSSYSPTRCAYTRGAVAQPVWRVQLQVRVADVEDAGTDDTLSVRLNSGASSVELPYGNVTAIDYGRDDFERNSNFIYDLDLAGVAELTDIHRIYLGKSGTDGVCLRDLSLVVNGRVVYSVVFGNSSSTCRWLDDSTVQSLSIEHAALRAHSSWLAYTTPPTPLAIPRAELESRIESLVGNAIATNDLQWGHLYGRAVEVSMVSRDVFHLDLDLESGVDNLPNPEVDVDMDMRVAFIPSTTQSGAWDLSITTISSSVNVDYAWYEELVSIALDPLCAPIASLSTGSLVWDCASSLESYIETRVEAALTPIEKAFGIGGNLPCAPLATVANDGGLQFGCR